MQRKQKHYAAMAMMPGMTTAWSNAYDGLEQKYQAMLDRARENPNWMARYTQEMQDLAKKTGADKAPLWQEVAQVSTHYGLRKLLFGKNLKR